MTKKKVSDSILHEDGDDAHFSGNPAYKGLKKRAGKKRVGAMKQHSTAYVRRNVVKSAGKKASRKRVAGK